MYICIYIYSVYSQQRLQGAVGLQPVRQLRGARGAGHHAQVEVEVREAAGRRHAATHAREVAVAELTAAQRQQPHGVRPQRLADVPHLGARQRLPADLDGAREHRGGGPGTRGSGPETQDPGLRTRGSGLRTRDSGPGAQDPGPRPRATTRSCVTSSPRPRAPTTLHTHTHTQYISIE